MLRTGIWYLFLPIKKITGEIEGNIIMSEVLNRNYVEYDIYNELLNKGEQVFLYPDELYSTYKIVNGASVNTGLEIKSMRAIDKNTYRGFHRANKTMTGPKELIDNYISSNLNNMIDGLKNVKSKYEFEVLANKITKELRNELSKNVKADMFNSYNKVRKSIDLLLEHIVSMSIELQDYRTILIPMLSVPLDSYILKSSVIFDNRAKISLRIKDNMTYKDIESMQQYYNIQKHIFEVASDLSTKYERKFYPIYFDLIWSDRYKRPGGNLFKTNP